MSFREKSAWVTLLAILLVFALFGLHIPRLLDPGHFEIHALLACFVAFLSIEVVAWVVLRLRGRERPIVDEQLHVALIVRDLGEIAIALKAFLRNRLIEHKLYIARYGDDMPEIRDWTWPGRPSA